MGAHVMTPLDITRMRMPSFPMAKRRPHSGRSDTCGFYSSREVRERHHGDLAQAVRYRLVILAAVITVRWRRFTSGSANFGLGRSFPTCVQSTAPASGKSNLAEVCHPE